MVEYRGQKVLITGGLGFIGSNLAIQLVHAGATVSILDSLHPNCGANYFNIDPIRRNVEVFEGDSCNLDLVSKLVLDKAYVFSLAGHVSHIDSMEDPFSDLQMNIVAPLTVLEACKRHNRDARIVYAGTRQVYGRPEALPVVETQRLRPIDVNGVNKMAGEWHHMVYHEAYGMRTVSLRMVNTFGPRQLVRHARQGFTGWFIKQAIEGEEIQLFGDGRQLRGFNYVDDAVAAIMTAAASPGIEGDCFNLGGQKPFALEAFVQILIGITGRGSYRIVPFPPEKRTIDVGSVYSSWSKFNFATGWTPKVSLHEGLARTVEYYQCHHAHYW